MTKERIAERVARRFTAAKAIDPEKFKALLLKMRKGVGSQSLKQWQTALETLGGWRIEKITGLVQVHDNAHDEHADEDQLERIKRDEVQVLPQHPVEGKHYTTDIGDLKKGAYGNFFTYRHWIGSIGVRVTSPEGRIFELLPSRYDVVSGSIANPVYRSLKLNDLRPEPLVSWMKKETKLLEQISNYLGMPTFEAERAKKRDDSAPRTRDGTGTCPCCFRNIKLKDKSAAMPAMVLHGYKRPGWGSVHGRCYGVDWPPFELSPSGTEHLINVLDKQEEQQKRYLVRLEAGEVTSITVEKHRGFEEIKLGDPRWERVYKNQISNTKSLIVGIGHDREWFKGEVAKWQLKPLPMQGGRIAPPPTFLT
jgi:hypothetical protein